MVVLTQMDFAERLPFETIGLFTVILLLSDRVPWCLS